MQRTVENLKVAKSFGPCWPVNKCIKDPHPPLCHSMVHFVTYHLLQICPNGIVCFGRRLQTYFIPRNGEFRYSFLGRACLAPYFSDLATYWGGNIYYRYINALDDTSAPEIELARTIVQRSQGVTIEPTFILITTYEEVPHYYAIFYYYYWNRGYSISEQVSL